MIIPQIELQLDICDIWKLSFFALILNTKDGQELNLFQCGEWTRIKPTSFYFSSIPLLFEG